MEHNNEHQLLDVIREFSEGQNSIDWTVAWEDDERFEAILDAIDSLVDNIALDVEIPLEKRINTIGKLSLFRSQLVFHYNQPKQAKAFVESGNELTKLLHEIVKMGNWTQDAEKRLEEYQEQAGDVDDEVPFTSEQLVYFRPVFIAIALITLIMFDQDVEEEE